MELGTAQRTVWAEAREKLANGVTEHADSASLWKVQHFSRQSNRPERRKMREIWQKEIEEGKIARCMRTHEMGLRGGRTVLLRLPRSEGDRSGLDIALFWFELGDSVVLQAKGAGLGVVHKTRIPRLSHWEGNWQR